MTGTTLAKVVTLLKSEIESSLSVGTANDTLYQTAVETKQEWFASMYNWQVLLDEWDFTFTSGSGGRYPTVPTTDTNSNAYSINFDRPVQLFVKYSDTWKCLDYGITVEDFNIRDSDAAEAQDPAMKWRFKPGDASKFELWPLGTVNQSCRVMGQRKVRTLRSAGVLDTTKVLDLDDRLVALAVAVDILTAREDPAAKPKSDMLSALWQTLRAAESPSRSTFSFASPLRQPNVRIVPAKVITV